MMSPVFLWAGFSVVDVWYKSVKWVVTRTGAGILRCFGWFLMILEELHETFYEAVIRYNSESYPLMSSELKVSSVKKKRNPKYDDWIISFLTDRWREKEREREKNLHLIALHERNTKVRKDTANVVNCCVWNAELRLRRDINVCDSRCCSPAEDSALHSPTAAGY